MKAKKIERMRTKKGVEVDPGRVGEVHTVVPDILHRLLDGGFVPVVAPVAVDDEGRSLNVNADTAASVVAAALKAEKLVLMTDIEGVKDGDKNLVRSLNRELATQLMNDGVIEGGMIPKVQCALDAIAGGVNKVHIVDGRLQHAMLLEIFTDRGIGTEIVQ
jgi:acetylglutamate kinase